MATTPDGTPFVEPGDSIAAYPTVSQELAAVIDSLRTMIPVGAVFPYAGKDAPDGYLLCDGKAYTRSDFLDLYTVMSDWVAEWGGFPGGNSQHFYVPDFRGRSPIGAGGEGVARPWRVGERWGHQLPGEHAHVITSVNPIKGLYGNNGPVTNGYSMAGQLPAVDNTQAFYANPIAPAPDYPDQGMGHSLNYQPSTGVNFIVWTGTTTAGKNPVPGVELAPVTTRMMIEARLEAAGIGEEEIEMLREQLAALKEDTDG